VLFCEILDCLYCLSKLAVEEEFDCFFNFKNLFSMLLEGFLSTDNFNLFELEIIFWELLTPIISLLEEDFSFLGIFSALLEL